MLLRPLFLMAAAAVRRTEALDVRLMYETKLERNRGATVTAIFSNAEVQRASSATATAKPSDPQQQQPPTVMRSVFTVLIPASRVWGVATGVSAI